MTLAVVAVLLTAAIGSIAFLGVQITRLDGKIERIDGKIDADSQRLSARIENDSRQLNSKIDALPRQLADEFRAMRADTAAQVSAIANAVTAAKETPTQVILIPAQPPLSGSAKP